MKSPELSRLSNIAADPRIRLRLEEVIARLFRGGVPLVLPAHLIPRDVRDEADYRCRCEVLRVKLMQFGLTASTEMFESDLQLILDACISGQLRASAPKEKT